jgi:hypothetical protein
MHDERISFARASEIVGYEGFRSHLERGLLGRASIHWPAQWPATIRRRVRNGGCSASLTSAFLRLAKMMDCSFSFAGVNAMVRTAA